MSGPRRHTASSINDDALDALYDNASQGWRRGDAWKRRAQQAEATVESLRTYAQQALDAGDTGPGAEIGRALLNLIGTEKPEEN